MIGIKAQYSIEFILVFAFSLVIIIPFINMIHSQYNENKESLDQSQAKKVMDDISIAVQNTYYSGYPSRVTLELYFPKGIDDIYAINVNSCGKLSGSLIFKTTKNNELVHPFQFYINEDITNTDGKRKVMILAEKNATVSITDVN